MQQFQNQSLLQLDPLKVPHFSQDKGKNPQYAMECLRQSILAAQPHFISHHPFLCDIPTLPLHFSRVPCFRCLKGSASCSSAWTVTRPTSNTISLVHYVSIEMFFMPSKDRAHLLVMCLFDIGRYISHFVIITF